MTSFYVLNAVTFLTQEFIRRNSVLSKLCHFTISGQEEGWKKRRLEEGLAGDLAWISRQEEPSRMQDASNIASSKNQYIKQQRSSISGHHQTIITMFSQKSGFLLAAGLLTAGARIVTASDEPPIDTPSEAVLQFSEDPYAGQDKLAMIQNGIAHLAAIRYETTSFSSDNNAYTQVYGDFCVYDAQLNKGDDPSLYSTINEMILSSDHCGDYTYTLPLDEVVAAVSSHDADAGQINPLLSGAIFHVGYAGAGLLSNTLATFEKTLVVSEHPAIHAALFACDDIHAKFSSADCSSLLQQKLFKDVITLATRNSDAKITHAYVKFRPDSTAYLPMVREIFPLVPWTFHYRDHETVLAKATQPKKNYCVYVRRQPSSVLAKKAEEYNLDLDGMTQEDLCALYLSTLLEVATQEHESSGTGKLVLYEQLLEVDFMLNELLPYLGLQAEIDADSATVSAKVEKSLSTKSSNRGGVKKWDANEEFVHISDKVRAASHLFMKNAMDAIGRM